MRSIHISTSDLLESRAEHGRRGARPDPDQIGPVSLPLSCIRIVKDYLLIYPVQVKSQLSESCEKLRGVFNVEPFWRNEVSWGKAPAVDIADNEKAYEITAELPGMDESNIDVKFSDGTLTIKGEKKDEKEEKKKDYYLSERRYGSFQRSFGVPDGVDAEKIEAHFKNGVLTVTLPKTLQAQKSEKKIAINKA
jgi:HSP20 family protein